MITLNDGEQITVDQLRAKYDAGLSRLICSYNPDGGLYTGVMVYDEDDDDMDMDTRGECAMMSEETWTIEPKSYEQLLKAAKVF